MFDERVRRLEFEPSALGTMQGSSSSSRDTEQRQQVGADSRLEARTRSPRKLAEREARREAAAAAAASLASLAPTGLEGAAEVDSEVRVRDDKMAASFEGRDGQQQFGPLEAQMRASGRSRRRRSGRAGRETSSRRGGQLSRALALLALALMLAAVGASQPSKPGPPEARAEEGGGGDSADRQFQLLRSANVELSRRGQRLQREAAGASSAEGGQQPTCGYPGSPAHASVTFNTSLIVAGTAASYTCDNGYELLGPPRRLCQANGTWLPVGIPFCGKFHLSTASGSARARTGQGRPVAGLASLGGAAQASARQLAG